MNWIELVSEYGLFLAKSLTIIIGIVLVLVVIVSLLTRNREEKQDHLDVRKLNTRYSEMANSMRDMMAGKQESKQLAKQLKQQRKQEEKHGSDKKRVFVLNFEGDVRASQVASLSEEITAILMVAREGDEVFLKLQSPGGLVYGYGLAASQLTRLRDKNIRLTAAVDKVAASGGYMMACVADHIIAAPFAIIGSVGVVAQLPNLNRLLKKHDVDYEMFTAGKFKRTVTVLGENTDEGREKFQQELEDTHVLFKEFIVKNRPGVDIEEIATGEHWYGTRALEHKLIDDIQSSDDWLLDKRHDADLYQVRYTRKKNLGTRLSLVLQSVVTGIRDMRFG